MRKILLILLLLLAITGFGLLMTGKDKTDLSKLPPLESGDLIFETTPGALFIMLATHSLYTHVGIVHKHADGQYTVLNSEAFVSERPLAQFITYSYGERITIERYAGLTDAQREAIVTQAEKYLGKPYNYIYYMKSDAIYCSELPYLAFNAEHAPLGRLEKIGDLHMDNFATRDIFNRLWQTHPLCKSPGMDYAKCWSAVMNEPIITPVSLARDPHLTTIYSNYPF